MILIITKVLCYHQVYVADDLFSIYSDSFAFIQMREPLDWRVKNKQEGFERPYLVSFQKEPARALDLVKKADVIIFGESPLKLIKHRKKECLLFKMSENIFKDTLSKISAYGRFKRWLSYKYLKMLTNNKHSYLLSCSGFAYKDYKKMGVFNNRALKWGYFPYVPKISLENIKRKFEDISTINIIWVSRLIKCKNPQYLPELVEYLLQKNLHNFHLTIIGNSDESDVDYFQMIKKDVKNRNLSDYITMVGKVDANKVFDYYLQSHIALFTGDKSEGWSVGLNEAMSCGCAIVASNSIGASPYLISNENGVVFKNDSLLEFCKATEFLLKQLNVIKEMAINNFEKIHNIWNHTTAAKRLSSVIDTYLVSKSIVPFENGPCSIATYMDYDWYKEQ